jgi:trimeric autotransporter adhesin
VNSGEVTSVFGGGKGGYESSDSPGTFVSENVNVVIGNSSYDAPTIKGEVFGGSAFGTVNGTTGDEEVSSYETTVTVNKGTITSVFGGGKGDSTYTPYVKGNATTIINDGKITNVFGGNDASGTVNGVVKVYLKGGEVTSTYGGGNMTSVNTTNVYLQGSTCEDIFGGSNNSGDVSTSNVTATSGTAVNIYGGNNQGGTTNTANVTLNGATIESIYGGGNVAVTTKTSVNLKSGKATSVYGGGKSASITSDTLVNLNGATCTNIFGGSNSSGDVPTSVVNINSGTATNVYGANNQGGLTTTTQINLEGGKVTNVFGGGNEASSVTSNIKLDGSNVSSIYGGGNEAGLTTSNINLLSGSATNVFGGSNNSGDVSKSNILTGTTQKDNVNINTELEMSISTSVVAVDSSWQDTNYNSVVTMNVTVTNNSSSTISEYTGKIKLLNSTLYSNYSGNDLTITDDTYSFNQINKYDSNRPYSLEPGASHTFSFQIYSKKTPSEFSIDDYSIVGVSESGDNFVQSNNKLVIASVYGGNNQGGTTDSTNIKLENGYVHNVFGGGNNAVVNDTNLVCNNMTIGGQLYGGGNNAGVNNSTKVEFISSSISGSIFGGGNNGFVGKNTDVYISSSSIGESVYAGGNGSSATTNGNATVTIDGTSNITKHVFGGGNAATTGIETENNSVSEVNIVGAIIGGNVYGGANTSKVFGNTKVNIGKDVVNKDNLEVSDIYIKGTIFGGGEANASGSENYDFSFISVTKGIDILIDGNNHDNFSINGSIFGSGNASSTSGYSNITISNYGTSSDIKKNISLQRADVVTINNSYLEFSGTTDRTNEYADELFSISRVDKLKIKNNTSLYLKNGANLLKHLVSAVDIGDDEVKATVLIDDETQEVVKNVDNRIYMYEGKVLNVATNQNITAYGVVDGMSFFGMYQTDRNGEIQTAMYNANYNYGDTATSGDLYYFTKGSYVLGLHKDNHDITVDGFYSNYDNKNDTGKIKTAYIEPTPENASYYMWSIGEQVSSYEISLTASKYLTLGTEELSLIRHSAANSVFSIVGFNYNDLASGVNLVKEDDVPRIADSGSLADNTMSLVMKTPSSGWMNNGETTFLSNADSQIYGTTTYKRENSELNPTLQFYLYHSKNLETSGDMGEVTISLLVVTPVSDLESEIERVNIVVKLNRVLYNTNDYEASITSGKQYGLFATDDVNITSTGSFSTYYSLYAEKEDFYKTGYHRVLVSDYVLPKNTKLTMIDYSNHDDPEYYYHVITEAEETAAITQFNNTGEVSYDFNKFIKMGSTSSDNKYDDSVKNNIYYDSTAKSAHEEFIFIVDFSESNITSSVIDKTLLIELRDSNEQTRVSVLGIEQSLMKYNLHTDKDSVIDITGSLDNTNVHPGDTVKLDVVTNFIQQTYNGSTVYDTSYFDNQLGIKISLYDSNNNLVTGASLLGFTYELDGVTYYPRMDGTVRINLAEKVSNVLAKIKIKTTDSLAAGVYTMKIESFGSSDGIYYGLESSDYTTLTFNVLDTVYGLSVSLPEKQVIINKTTGKTLNNNNVLVFNYKYNSVLNNPKVYISLKRRDYSSVYSTSYTSVDIKDYVTNNYSNSVRNYEYLLSSNPVNNTDVFIYLKENLMTGTYKVVFSLYDGDSYIGEVYNYIIIK